MIISVTKLSEDHAPREL